MSDYVLGKRLQEARKEKGWSQTELAKRAGVHSVLISKVERGKTQQSINSDTLRALCKALEVSANYILELPERERA